jgi:predicted transcriptional regulator
MGCIAKSEFSHREVTMDTSETITPTDMLAQLTSNIVTAYVTNHNVPANELPALIQSTFQALQSPASDVAEQPVRKDPAVPVSKSIDKKGEFIICLEDGKKFKSMKRHLSTIYKMTPEQYREKWDLPIDYPMVAPEYAKRRSDLAKDMGLGKVGAKAA